MARAGLSGSLRLRKPRRDNGERRSYSCECGCSRAIAKSPPSSVRLRPLEIVPHMRHQDQPAGFLLSDPAGVDDFTVVEADRRLSRERRLEDVDCIEAVPPEVLENADEHYGIRADFDSGFFDQLTNGGVDRLLAAFNSTSWHAPQPAVRIADEKQATIVLDRGGCA